MQEVPTRTRLIGGNNARFARSLLAWYDRVRRDLPWRPPLNPVNTRAPRAARRPGSRNRQRVDPYHVLVSEVMLQQTQVSTVVPYFRRFVAALPTVRALADADEQVVLRLWQGLGYYRRARNLQRAAREILNLHGGTVPSEPSSLQSLPGIGRYTAGAIASIAYDIRAPILDGNVARVLCRLDAVGTDPRTDRPTAERLWRRAEDMLPAQGGRIGDFNSALMELGATVCTPRNPRCEVCPVRSACLAVARGVQAVIPPLRKARPSPLHRRVSLIVARPDGHLLIEQRPDSGRWAGLWQLPTFDPQSSESREILRPDRSRSPIDVRLSILLGVTVEGVVKVGLVRHALSHRRYEFTIYAARTTCKAAPIAPDRRPRLWIRPGWLGRYPFPRPHLRMIELAAGSPWPQQRRPTG